MALSKALTSLFPAIALFLGLILVLSGSFWDGVQYTATGWGLVTVAFVVEIVLPLGRRLR